MAISWLRPLFWLTVLWMIPILLIRPQPYDTSQAQALLEPPPGCPTPCFMGIRPGTTNLETALKLLKEHEWVQQVAMERYELESRGLRGSGTLAWEWTADHHPQIDSAYPGKLNYTQTLGGTVVNSINIHTHLRPVEVAVWVGSPDAARINQFSDNQISYLLTYSYITSWNSIKTTLGCPIRLMDVWHSEAELTIAPRQIPGEIKTITELARTC